jgi:hypothetical protein
MSKVSRFYTDCRAGCGFRVGRNTPRLVCAACRWEHGIEPIPKPLPGQPESDHARYRRLTAPTEGIRRILRGID